MHRALTAPRCPRLDERRLRCRACIAENERPDPIAVQPALVIELHALKDAPAVGAADCDTGDALVKLARIEHIDLGASARARCSQPIEEKGVDEIILKGIAASDFHRLRDIATSIILLGVQSNRPM